VSEVSENSPVFELMTNPHYCYICYICYI
jgi:hypothetical protein